MANETASEPEAVAARNFPLIDRQPARAGWWALACGVLTACGFQPLGLWPLALLAMGACTLLFARATGPKQAAWLGWLFGLGYFTLGNNWIALAFTYQAKMPVILGVLAVPLLSLYLAIYPAIAAALARAIARKGGGIAFALVFAASWVVTEWARAAIPLGYAWNPLSMVLLGPFERPGIASLAPFMGTYALSGIAVLLGCGLVLLLVARRYPFLGGLALVLAIAMYRPGPAPQDSDLLATLVQPNIPQDLLHEPALYEEHFRSLADQSLPRDIGGKRIVLWPESGMTDYLREGYPQRYYNATTAFGSPVLARRRLGSVVGRDSILLTGAVDLEIGEVENYVRAVGARNAVTVLDAEGDIIGSYYKSHLVPFGEYLPFRSILEPIGIARLVPGSFDFWPGPGPQTLDLGAYGQAGILICYEIVFSGEQTQPGNRPDYIFNPSNDGWYGMFGPPQHLAQARMRAIEEGLPVLRSTTTGISGIIDAHGVVRGSLPMNVAGRIDLRVPQALPPTLFARFGNALGLAWAAIFLAAGLIALRRPRG